MRKLWFALTVCLLAGPVLGQDDLFDPSRGRSFDQSFQSNVW